MILLHKIKEKITLSLILPRRAESFGQTPEEYRAN